MPSRLLFLLVSLTAALASCGGDERADDGPPVLDRSSFAEVVRSELRSADVEVGEGSGFEVHAEKGLDWVDVALEQAFAAYRRAPERRETVVAAVVDETLRRLDEGVGELSFAAARSSLMPLLKPRFTLRTLEEEPAQTTFPADLAVVYAVARENEFLVVTPTDVRRWGTSLARVHEAAVANLLRQTETEEKLLCEPLAGNELCGWASGDGYDATRMVVPALRRQIEEVYDGPAVYAVPMESVFVALSFEIATRRNTEEALRAKVERDFSMADDPVSPELFVERRGKLVVF
ncbi:MAG TPA: DUF1444 family protein [Gaiellaceae bacterium]|nr:DUF1444 family protein [Gaiellaceae bacterium]